MEKTFDELQREATAAKEKARMTPGASIAAIQVAWDGFCLRTLQATPQPHLVANMLPVELAKYGERQAAIAQEALAFFSDPTNWMAKVQAPAPVNQRYVGMMGLQAGEFVEGLRRRYIAVTPTKTGLTVHPLSRVTSDDKKQLSLHCNDIRSFLLTQGAALEL